MSTNNIILDEENRCFVLEVDGHKARVEFIRRPPKFFVTHTEVPKALEGQGIGSKMIKYVFEYIKEQNLRLVPLCPFAAAYIQRHPEWAEILAQGYSVK
jgi:predicted GNAT family acetyltransferase